MNIRVSRLFPQHTAWLLALLALSPLCRAQDPLFSQFYSSRLALNPAMAGYEPGANAYLAYRNQSVLSPLGSGQFHTQHMALSMELPRYWSGLGIQATQSTEGAGALRWQQAGLQYAFRNRVCRRDVHPGRTLYRSEFSLGLEATWNQWTFRNVQGLVFADQLHPWLGQTGSVSDLPDAWKGDWRPGYLDFNFGAMWHQQFGGSGGIWQAGYAVRHLPQRDVSFGLADDRRPVRHTLHFGLKRQGSWRSRPLWGIVTLRADFQPGSYGAGGGRFWHRSVQAGYQADWGKESGFWIGGWYQGRISGPQGHLHSAVGALGFRGTLPGPAPARWRAGFSYDQPLVNQFWSGFGGRSAELFLGFQFPAMVPRGLRCGDTQLDCPDCPSPF
jgi:type IX secretion system PorP/SprF family membrane protein